jgi:site-specific recombinase XerD
MDAFDSIRASRAAWLRTSVIAPFVPAYWRRLTERQYAPDTVQHYMCGLAHFAHWSRRARFELGSLSPAVERFIAEHLPRCRCQYPVLRGPLLVRAALHHLQAVLADHGIHDDLRIVDPADDDLRRFDEYLRDAGGLASSTRHRRRTVVASLLHTTSSLTPSADELRAFVAREIARLSPVGGAAVATALRSYLRFRAFEGDRVGHLLPLIVSPAHWRLAGLPQTLSRAEVEQLLGAFPPELPSRHRAYAMVRCIVDLGLRTSEVTGLNLEDIDWAAGTLRIAKGKSRRVDVMPLPEATGSAIADYIRLERPQTVNRRVFVRHVAPVDEPIGTKAVRRAVIEAYRRSGLPHTRIHILRHTLAGRLLDTGGTLKEVADVLRHRELTTTMIYAKIDIGRLAAVAMPWPGSAT